MTKSKFGNIIDYLFNMTTEENNNIIDETTENNSVEEQIQEEKAPETSLEDQLKAEVAELKDKNLRLYSEFENFRRRTSKEKLELIGTATESLMKDLLPTIDDFERAQKAFESSEDFVAIKDGISLIYNKLTKTLEQKGLKEIEAQDQVFDADSHEAITQIPSPTEEMKGKVIDVVERGFTLNGKIIRYSKVVIGS